MDFRDSLFDAIHAIMRADPSVLAITNDMGALGLDAIRADWPDRVINIGIAEQNLMSVAGGLARCGKKIFCFGIGAHVTGRAWEQIKLDICALGLPVVITGVGGGLAYGQDGITHHATEDVALMLTLPNMAIYNPCDPVCAMLSVQHAYRRGGPAYLRLDKQSVPLLYDPADEVADGFCELRRGTDATLLSTGVITHAALAACDLLAEDGIALRLIDVHRLKPLSGAAWQRMVGGARHVFSLEEHNLSNGFGGQVAIHLATNGGARLTMLGLPDAFPQGSASRRWAHARFGLTPEAIAARIRKDLGRVGAAREVAVSDG